MRPRPFVYREVARVPGIGKTQRGREGGALPVAYRRHMEPSDQADERLPNVDNLMVGDRCELFIRHPVAS